MKALALVLLLIGSLLLAPTQANAACPNGKVNQGAMWLSILHPGLGEWHQKGWGGFKNMPQKKFWFGFIPGFGWPGYLQVKSARDSSECRTNDEMFNWDAP
jgi:hypothetical protein